MTSAEKKLIRNTLKLLHDAQEALSQIDRDGIDELQGVRNVFAEGTEDERLRVRQLAVSKAIEDESVTGREWGQLRTSVPAAVNYLYDMHPEAIKDLAREILLAWAEAEMGEESPFYMTQAAQDVLADLEFDADVEDE